MRTLSYESVLDRGFAVVFDADGKPIKLAASVSEGDALSIRFRDGDVSATAGHGPETASPKGATRKASSSGPGGQGSLF
jgi:exodeoxyribonuclease VII large subunit